MSASSRWARPSRRSRSPMALDSGKYNINSTFDARSGLRYGSFTIGDYHATTRRVLTVPEVFVHSSNIGTARMALGIGVEGHKAFLRKMGQLTRLETELPESAEPIVPPRWGELNTMTIAFGHGLAVAPLQALMAVGALVNGGVMIKPTFLKRDEAEAAAERAAGAQARDERGDALCDAPQRVERRKAPRAPRLRRRLLRRRQDRHRREGDQRPLLQEQELHDLHGGGAGRQAEIRVPHHHGRAAGGRRHLWLLDRRLECRSRDRQHRSSASRRCSACRRASSRRRSPSR